MIDFFIRNSDILYYYPVFQAPFLEKNGNCSDRTCRAENGIYFKSKIQQMSIKICISIC